MGGVGGVGGVGGGVGGVGGIGGVGGDGGVGGVIPARRASPRNATVRLEVFLRTPSWMNPR